MTSSLTGGLKSFRRADTVVLAVEEDRQILSANVKQHFQPPTADVMHGASSVSQVAISQPARQPAFDFYFSFFFFFLLSQRRVYLQIIKAQMMCRTVCGTNGLLGCLSSFSGDLFNDHIMIFRIWNRQIRFPHCRL